ncbi:hypothetical protein RND81_05G132500 [Saponaria officinalis]|uniref:DUF223 domain-containing protein n=1 Tax=Saponaria officinalis TaxID=3572 RepID=A0AAW1KXZ4_SAPOF
MAKKRTKCNQERWKIKVRVSRLWEVRNYKNHDSLICVDMVLIDEEGGYVHATIKGDFADKFRSKLTEGGVYIFGNFAIEPNKSMYLVVSDNKIMIRFFYNTYIKAVKEEDYVISKHKFDFSPYPTLEHRHLKFDFLSDVYGVLLNETKEGNATSIEIQDASEKNNEIIVGNVEVGDDNDMFAKKKDILTIINHCKEPYEKDLYCYCLAEVKEVMSELPWYNPSCPDCNKKLKKGIHDFFCEKCNKSIINPTLVYRLELLVEDNT